MKLDYLFPFQTHPEQIVRRQCPGETWKDEKVWRLIYLNARQSCWLSRDEFEVGKEEQQLTDVTMETMKIGIFVLLWTASLQKTSVYASSSVDYEVGHVRRQGRCLLDVKGDFNEFY